MIKAVLNEIRTTPIAALGALAGIASLVFVVATSAATAQVTSVAGQSSVGAIALIKMALLVPGVSFFFAFLTHLSFIAGPLRAAFATVVFLIISEVFTAAGCGLILAPMRVHYDMNDNPVVLEIPVIAISGAILVLNALVFAAVNAPTMTGAIHSLFKPQENRDAEEEFDSGYEPMFIILGGFVTIAAMFALAHFVLNASLGLANG